MLCVVLQVALLVIRLHLKQLHEDRDKADQAREAWRTRGIQDEVRR